MAKITRRGFIKGAAVMSAAPFLAEANEKKSETLKFIHITDSHMDLSNNESVDAMILMVEFINKNHTDLDFVLFGGDNFNNNVEGNRDALAYKEIVEKLSCPAYHVRGNKEAHPNPDDAIHLEEFKTLFVSSPALKVKGKDWLLETKGYALLGLDSCIEGANNGKYTEETIQFAEATLKTGKPTIILNHHPYTNYWKGTDPKDIHKYVLNNTQEVQKRIFGFDNLILTLSGHKHIDSVTKINQTNVIVTRGFIRPRDMDMFPMRLVEITEGKVSEKLIYTA
jgi:Icc protein